MTATTTHLAAKIPPFGEYAPPTNNTHDLLLLTSCLLFWTYAYYSTVLHPKRGTPTGFDASTFISNLHSVPLCILALLSVLEYVPEIYPLSWSLSFFVLDLVDTIVRRDGMWFVHAVISLILNVATGFSVRHRVLRSVSKGFFTEGSTPFLNHWKKSKSYPSFLLFFASFTLSRIIWTPYFVYNTYIQKLQGDLDFLIYPSILFYLLQCAWYTKMCGMVFSYRDPREQAERVLKNQ